MDKYLREEINLLQNRVCYALKDPSCIMILYALAEKPLYVNELAAELNQPQSTISRHLTVLRNRSLVNAEREGQSVRYSIADKRIIYALDLMRSMLHDAVRSDANLLESISR